MAVHVFKNAFVSVAGVNLSSRCTKVEVEDGYDELDVKAMSNTAGNTAVGMKAQSIKATFLQDFAAANVHATLQALQGLTGAIIVRPDSAAASATNPSWTCTMLLTKYSPIAASVGDKYEVSVEFKTIGTAITYAEA